MNVVFWALVIVVMALIWFCLSFAFKWIGSIFLRLFNDAKKEIMGDESEKSNKEQKEQSSDEG